MTPQEETRSHRLVEEALTAVVRLLKAVGYYPPGHPSLDAALAETRKAFAPVLADGSPLALSVRRYGFLQGTTPLSPAPVLKGLASTLFARRVESLTLLPELTEGDLLSFSRLLCRDPDDLLRQGGIAEALRKAQVSTVWVNETDLARILERRALLAEPDPASEEFVPSGTGSEDLAVAEPEELRRDAPPAVYAYPGEELFEVLAKLRREKSDQNYRQLLGELVPLIDARLTPDCRYPVLEVLEFLLEQSRAGKANPLRREESLRALEQLASARLVAFLIDFLCDPAAEKDLREKVLKVLLFYREISPSPLMERLSAETAPQIRRALMESLVALDEAAVPTLLAHLRDERWFVVRNAAAVLGEIRRPETVGAFPPLIAHPDLRVRREAIRALTRIGGPEAVLILLQSVEGEDPELSRQALLSLGALRHPAAVPTLLRLAGRPDPFVRRAELRKGAVRALGEIGAPQAVPLLEKIVRRRPLWRRALADEVRAAAATALGEIADGGTAVLEKALDDRSADVVRAASQALKSIRKGHHGSGTK